MIEVMIHPPSFWMGFVAGPLVVLLVALIATWVQQISKKL